MIWSWWRHYVAYWYKLYDDFYMMMRCHEDTVMLRSTTGFYGWTCIEVAYQEIMIHSTATVLGDVSSRIVVGVSSWYITHGRHTWVNTSVGTVYDIFWFSLYKIYMYYVFKSICIIKGTLVVSDFNLARRCSEKVCNRSWVLKKRLIHRHNVVLLWLDTWWFYAYMCIYIYIFTLIL